MDAACGQSYRTFRRIFTVGSEHLMSTMRRLRSIGRLLLVALIALPAAAMAQNYYGESTIRGLTATGEPAMAKGGKPAVEGYLNNDSKYWWRHVQLRVDALDASGGVTSSGIAWVDPTVPPGSRVYFKVPAPAAAPSYRVVVINGDMLRVSGP